MTPSPAFDVDGARKAGYSDDEILQHLTSSRNFDISGAMKSGYSKQDIIQHLSSTPPPASDTRGVSKLPGGVAPGVDKPPIPYSLTAGSPSMSEPQITIPSRNQFSNDPAGSISHVARGVATATAPLAAPAALMNPIGAAATVASGYAVGKGAKAAGGYFGASHGVQDLLEDAGNAAGGYVGKKLGADLVSKVQGLSDANKSKAARAAIDAIPYVGKKINNFRDAMAPEPFAPFKPNPAVADKMKFGGPLKEYKGKSYKQVGMSGAPDAPVAEVPEAAKDFEPFKPNPNIAKKMSYSPADADSGYDAARPAIPQRIAGTPARDLPGMKLPAPEGSTPPIKYTGPSKVNPNIAKKMKFTAGGEDQYKGSAGDQAGSTLGTRAEMIRQVRLKGKELNKPRASFDPLGLQQYIDVEPNQ